MQISIWMDRQTCHFCFCTLLINWLTGNFRAVQIFTFFEGRAVNAKIKTGINSHESVFYMQSLLVGGVVFWHWNANICEKFRGLSSNFVKIGTRENFPLFRYNNSYNHVEFVGDQVVPCNRTIIPLCTCLTCKCLFCLFSAPLCMAKK